MISAMMATQQEDRHGNKTDESGLHHHRHHHHQRNLFKTKLKFFNSNSSTLPQFKKKKFSFSFGGL